MTEQYNPVDIGKEQIEKYKELVEKELTDFHFRTSPHQNLPDLLRAIDPEEKHIMSPIERDVYITLREGMQIYKTIADLLGDKVELKKKIVAAIDVDISENPELNTLKEFCYNYAAFAASKYISKKLDHLIKSKNGFELEKKSDLSALRLEAYKPEDVVMRMLMTPVYATIIKHKDEDTKLQPLELPFYIKEIFDKYNELTLNKKDAHAELNKKHLEGYRFRIMDDFLVLEMYEDKSISVDTGKKQEISFQPITAKEIVGNKSAKRKISRYIDRLALYNIEKQINPILELGGLSWTNLFDGPPGTGKTSLFRLAMTLLKKRAEQLGINYNIISIDQGIKDEYYGKTGKILLERLNPTHDPNALSMAIFDDIDLLTSSRSDAQGADNDINNITMQYLDGAFTVRRGNVINFAASNKPTGLDEAMRNRFNDRVLIDGPTTSEDFADIVHIMGDVLIKKKLLKMENKYKPFETQDNIDESGKWSVEDVAEYTADEFKKHKNASIIDFGNFMAELKEKNPLITGRSMKAVMESVKERTADFDIPEEWYTDRSKFFDLSYDNKIKTLAELYKPITADILFQEAKRYFDSEERFKSTEAEERVTEGYNSRKWDIEARIKHIKDEIKKIGKGDESGFAELARLEGELNELIEQKQKQE